MGGEERPLGVPLSTIIDAARQKCLYWAFHPHHAFEISDLAGGMSNVMKTVTLTSEESTGEHDHAHCARKAVARLLSPALDAVIDRPREHKIVRYLATAGIGPRLFGTFAVQPSPAAAPPTPSQLLSSPSLATPRSLTLLAKSAIMMRFEEFVDGRTLVVGDLRGDADIAQRMAQKLAMLHAQRPDLREKQAQLSARSQGSDSSSPVASFGGGGRGAPSQFEDDGAPALAPVPDFQPSLQRYLALIHSISQHPKLLMPGRVRPELAQLVAGPGFDWAAEAAWFGALFARHGGATILCHGDAQPGNWIAEHTSGELCESK